MTSRDVPADISNNCRKPAGRNVSRKQVVSRLWRAAERQVEEIETRMRRLAGDKPADWAPAADHQALEREAKTLAIIAKTIRDLVAIDNEAAEARRPKGAGTAHGKRAVPETATELGEDANASRDINEFRAELARRLDELRRERRGDEAS